MAMAIDDRMLRFTLEQKQGKENSKGMNKKILRNTCH
jgi:hypothetical protein